VKEHAAHAATEAIKLICTERRVLGWQCAGRDWCAAPLAHNGTNQWGENMPNMSLYRSKLLRQSSDPAGKDLRHTHPPPQPSNQPPRVGFVRGDQVVKPPTKAQLMSGGRPVLGR
jgi:hypothetical protein